MINQLSIKNFKSIKELDFNPKRINVFIGAPNVGKSNILEALSLFNVPYIENSENKFEGLIRHKNLKNLFYDNIPNEKIEVKTNIGVAQLRYRYNLDTCDLFLGKDSLNDKDLVLEKDYSTLISKLNKLNERHPNAFNSDEITFFFSYFNQSGKIFQTDVSNHYSSIRKYTFKKDIEGINGYFKYLLPPHGENINTIILRNKEIHKEAASFFEIYGLEFLYDTENNLFEIQKKQEKLIYKYPYKLIADTLQRIIFYLTVVETNKNTSILLEEPETHSYPPYTKMLAKRIALSDTNQFFITTHSPYLLYNLIENTEFEERNIIIADYKDYQTKIKILSKDEIINRILEDKIEIFFNMDKFLSDE
ncbi:MAG: AAA family ATPase [Bacteroidales bacterium]|nr:AAA family ATPase [Bacteroidales bacterium]